MLLAIHLTTEISFWSELCTNILFAIIWLHNDNELFYGIIPSPSSAPRPSIPPACSMQKWREVWEILSRYPHHDSHMSSHLNSTAKWCTRPILHSVQAMEREQAPAESYTKCMKHTQAKNHDSNRLQSDKRENNPAVMQLSHRVKRRHYKELHCLQPSLSG